MSANVINKGLGLREDFRDPRDANFPFRLKRHEEPVALATKRWAFFDRIIDQGFTGTCVGHMLKYELAFGPVIEVDMHEAPSAFELYRQCCLRDPWPENDNGDLDFGTSMNAAGRVLRDMGRIERWEHSENPDDVLKFIAGVNADGKHIGGPVMVGVPWYEGMFDTDSLGYVHATGEIAGYHAILLPHYNVEKDELWFPQSWGYFFGPWDRERGRQTGYGRMSGATLRTLFENGGEAIIAREIRASR